MKIQELSDYNVDRDVISIFEKEGLSELFPPQIDALKANVLDQKNFVISIPTASGKTLIAELAILSTLKKTHKKALYIVPLKALASEKFKDFKKYEELGYKIGKSTGDLDSSDHWLKDYDIIIITSEKMDSICLSFIVPLSFFLATNKMSRPSSKVTTSKPVLSRQNKMISFDKK